MKLNHAAGYVTGSRYRVVDEYSCVAELTKPNFFLRARFHLEPIAATQCAFQEPLLK